MSPASTRDIARVRVGARDFYLSTHGHETRRHQEFRDHDARAHVRARDGWLQSGNRPITGK